MFEDGGREPKTKEYRQPPEVEKDKEIDSPLRASRRNLFCRYLDFSPIETDFGLLITRTIREHISCFKPPFVVTFYSSNRKLMQAGFWVRVLAERWAEGTRNDSIE